MSLLTLTPLKTEMLPDKHQHSHSICSRFMFSTVCDSSMTQPLALVVYEKLLPGSQLVNRLQDLKYRVQTLAEPAQLTAMATETKPMLVFIDLEPTGKDVVGAIKHLKADVQTSHIPVVGFTLYTVVR